MKLRMAVLLLALAAGGIAQRQPPNRTLRLPSRGTRGAVAAGSEYATEAGMRMYFSGGNAVDAGVATMLAASVCEFSHFGLGGEAPILMRTKDGKVHSIAGVGTMPKLATAEFFRDHKLQPGEILDPPEQGGLKEWCRWPGIMPALVPGMVDAALVALREYGTKSFAEVVQPAIELADGFPIDEMRADGHRAQRAILGAVAALRKRVFLPDGRMPQAGRDLPPAGPGAHAALHGGGGEEGAGGGREPRQGHRRRARLLLSRRDRAQHRRVHRKTNGGLLRYEDMAAFHAGAGRSRSPPLSTATRFTSRASGARGRR